MSGPENAPGARRLLLPPAIVLALALALSLGLHVPAYVGLGLLKILLRAPPALPESMELEIVESAPTPPRTVDEAAPVAEARDDEEAVTARPDRPPSEAASPTPVVAERPPEPEPPAPAAPSAAPPVAQPEPEQLTSVMHHSRDPTVEPPPEAQHLAEENSRVEEETLARIRNPNLDDVEPEPPSTSEPTPAAEQEGDAAEAETAELHEAEGSDERDPTREEAVVEPPREPPREASRSRTPSMSEAAAGEARAGGAAEPGAARAAAGGGRRAEGGGERAMRDVVVSDGIGTWTMRVPVERPVGEGEGEGGGAAIAGHGAGRAGEGRASGAAGRSGRRARGGAAAGGGADALRVSWSQFATLYGEEELERQREAYLEHRRSRVAGMSSGERWRRFRAAIESYDVRVRPGNQTALNTRADPFAAFVAAMHNRIHPRFAGGYLLRVPSSVESTYRANSEMHTKLELAIDAQGRVDHVSVVNTSGDMLFDLGAFESVMGAAPFDVPPERIRSPDGLVYVHWSFYRNHRQCGTFNAQMFILASAPTPRRPRAQEDLTDRGPTPFVPAGPETPTPEGARPAPVVERERP